MQLSVKPFYSLAIVSKIRRQQKQIPDRLEADIFDLTKEFDFQMYFTVGRAVQQTDGLSDAFYSGLFCFADLGSLIYKHAIPTHHESTSGMLAQFHINVRAQESRRPTCIGLSMKNVLQRKYFFRKMFNTTKGVKLGVEREREGGEWGT